MDYPGTTIARDFEGIKARAGELGVSLSWALKRRREHLQSLIKENEALVVEYVKQLGRVNKLGRAFLLNWIANAQTRNKNARFDLSRLKPQAKGNGVTPEEIERAKEYPVVQLLPNQIKHGMTLCPFHDDRNPSMSIKNNRAHCFSCDKTWDSIALAMELKSLEFVGTVKYLNQVQ